MQAAVNCKAHLNIGYLSLWDNYTYTVHFIFNWQPW